MAEMTEKSRLPGVTAIWQQPIRPHRHARHGHPDAGRRQAFGPDLATLEKRPMKSRRSSGAFRERRRIYAEQILGPVSEIAVDGKLRRDMASTSETSST